MSNPWSPVQKGIKRAFQSHEGYAIYDSCFRNGTWMAGGCWIAAEAIKRVFGGSLVMLVSERGPEHIVVDKQDWLIDTRGEASQAEQFIRDYKAYERSVETYYHKTLDKDFARDYRIVYKAKAIKPLMALIRAFQ